MREGRIGEQLARLHAQLTSANFFLPSFTASSSGPRPTAAARFEPRERLPPLPSPPLLLGSAAHLDVARKLPLVLLTRCDGGGGDGGRTRQSGRGFLSPSSLAVLRGRERRRRRRRRTESCLCRRPTPPRQRLCLYTSSFRAAAIALTRKSAYPRFTHLHCVISYC